MNGRFFVIIESNILLYISSCIHIGTEKDRVNCPFYFKIGACRHGDRCSRLHTKPSISPTLVLANMYQRPDMITPAVSVDPQVQPPSDPRKTQQHFEV